MRVVILTSRRMGFASVALPRLASADGIELAGVVFNERQQVSRSRRWKRQLRKVRRIGLLGALNGVRMRRWYKRDVRQWVQLEPIDDLARRLSVPLLRTPAIGGQRTRELFEELEPELGLSLGNGYIPSRVFTVPRHGMINVHHELLPEFRGAQSVLWQLYHGSTRTGFSIHQIDRSIDTGAILYREEMPIELRSTLAETVSYNYAALWTRSAERLPEVVARYDELSAAVSPQGEGRSYTTPTIGQFMTMLEQYRRLRKGEVGAGPASGGS